MHGLAAPLQVSCDDQQLWLLSIHGLAEPRMRELIYITTDPVAVVAATALRTMGEAAMNPDGSRESVSQVV